jgi:hypothetical protein
MTAENPMPMTTQDDSLQAMYDKIDAVEHQAVQLGTKARDLWRQLDQTLLDFDVESTHNMTHVDASALRYACAGLQEEYVRLLFQLDAVESFGDSDLRARRKEVVKAIQGFIEAAEFHTKRASDLVFQIKALSPLEPTRQQLSSSEATNPAPQPAKQPDANTDRTENTQVENEVDHEHASASSEATRPTSPSHPSHNTNANRTSPSLSVPSLTAKPYTPRATVTDNRNHWLAAVHLPHIALRDINFDIKLSNTAQFLTISGVRHQTHREKLIASQCGSQAVPPHGPFSVTFKFPLSADIDSSEAFIRGQELIITVPKSALPQRHVSPFDPFGERQRATFDPFQQLVW